MRYRSDLEILALAVFIYQSSQPLIDPQKLVNQMKLKILLQTYPSQDNVASWILGFIMSSNLFPHDMVCVNVICFVDQLSYLDILLLDMLRDVGEVYFSLNHPMKPHLLRMTRHLVLSFELHKKMEASTFWKKSKKHMWSLRRGASTVRSVASTASAIVERDSEIKHDQVTFAYNKDPSP
ncbi:Histone deacetylase 9 [Sesamum angolense]|uniref:Histone deacetylase 9 n=1 Tax=Sesamum angolense TaxID=2727404 RepID=A0AAE1T6W3_9LAMI|nr:Histone deacetylase 9 [Sesamum angolense]